MQRITQCPGSGSGSQFYGDIEWDQYLPFAGCRCCGEYIMLLCAPDCVGSHDYTDEVACGLVLADHSKAR